jgi:hypothetical protein
VSAVCAGRRATWGDVQAMITDKSGDAFSVLITVGVADASIVDHTPEELLNVTATGTLSSVSSGVAHWAVHRPADSTSNRSFLSALSE